MMERIRQQALLLGAYRAEIVKVEEIALDASFRTLCESNACGNYGRNYMCPPDAGDIHVLMEAIRRYDSAVIYQTVTPLEDSYDFEGMMEAGSKHNRLAQKLWDFTDEAVGKNVLHLGAGGCRLCPSCNKIRGMACAHPDRAMASLETYGINVSQLAKLAGMCYINGQNTVTYFGGVFGFDGQR